MGLSSSSDMRVLVMLCPGLNSCRCPTCCYRKGKVAFKDDVARFVVPGPDTMRENIPLVHVQVLGGGRL